MPHLERRANLWYAVLIVPKDAREALGKYKLIKSLKTPSKREADRRSLPLIAKWRSMIDRARGRSDAVLREALACRDAIAEAKHRDAHAVHAVQHEFEESEADVQESLLVDHAHEIERTKGSEAAHSFYKIASGQHTPSQLHLPEWESQLNLALKTKEQMTRDVRLMVARFPVLQEIGRREVRKWLLEELNATPSSANRIASFCRNYWKYLKTIHALPEDAPGPFDKLDVQRVNKKSESKWLPFAPDHVVKLWKEAKEKQDDSLADLIALGAYTGARIEELCSLKLKDIKDAVMHVTDAKTEAGIRDVPLHSALRPLVHRLCTASQDGYLLSGLSFNKYGDRSNALGKRFGRLKECLGFSERYVFHSIRKTLVTALENEGVGENVAADIVGHEKPRITYGLYSGGASLEVKRKALERVRYPFGKLK